MTEQEGFQKNHPQPASVICSEVIIGKTIYCVTGVFSGNLNVAKTLEDLAIAEIIRCISLGKSQNVKEVWK